jgi:hypothetical protein
VTPLTYLQNALLIAAVFATYWLTGSWWGWLWLLLWLGPAGKSESDKDAIVLPETPRIITPERKP